MLRRLSFLVMLAAALAPGLSNAEIKATPLPRDSRLVTFTYDADNTFLVLTRRGDVTRLQLAEDEEIVTLACGDTKTFHVQHTNDGKHILIRPTFDNASTSLSLITNKRAYEIVLRSTFEGGRWYQRVQWEYPDLIAADFSRRKAAEAKMLTSEPEAAQANPVSGLRVEDLHFDYSVSGDAAFRPAQVFDNGTFTFLLMPPGLQDLPALFAVADDDLVLLNYVVEDRYLKIQRIVPELVLKSGKSEVRITRSRHSSASSIFGSGA